MTPKCTSEPMPDTTLFPTCPNCGETRLELTFKPNASSPIECECMCCHDVHVVADLPWRGEKDL